MHNDLQRRFVHSLLPSIIQAALHGMLWLGLLAVLVFVVPNYIRTLESFGTELPTVTLIVIKTSHYAVLFWWLIIPMIAVLAAGDGAIILALSASPRLKLFKVLWGILMLLLPAAAIALVVVGIQLPMIQLINSLS